MKKILLVLFALALATNAIFAQETVKERFSGFGIISSVSGTSPTYTINVISFTGSPRFQPNGTWVGSDVATGDVVWFDCARYVITTVNSSGLNSLNVTVTVPAADETAGVSSPSPGQVCAVVRELPGFIPAFPVSGDNAGSGIPITLSSCLHTHYASLPVVGGADDQTAAEVTATATAPLTGTTVQAQLNELAGNTHTPVTVTDGSKVDFTLTGQELTATIVPGSIQGSDLAQQGATAGQVLKFNGTAWVPQTDNDNQNATGVAATATAPLTGATVQAQLDELAADTHDPVTVTDGAQVDLTLSGQNITAGIVSNSIDSTHIKVGGLELEGLSRDGAVVGQTIKWDGTSWKPYEDLKAQFIPDNTIYVDAQAFGPFTEPEYLIGLSDQGATLGQVLKWNGMGWVPQNETPSNSIYTASDTMISGLHANSVGNWTFGADSDPNNSYSPTQIGITNILNEDLMQVSNNKNSKEVTIDMYNTPTFTGLTSFISGTGGGGGASVDISSSANEGKAALTSGGGYIKSSTLPIKGKKGIKIVSNLGNNAEGGFYVGDPQYIQDYLGTTVLRGERKTGIFWQGQEASVSSNNVYKIFEADYTTALVKADSNNISVKFYNGAYRLPNAKPSITNTTKQSIVWTGNGTAATPAFETIITPAQVTQQIADSTLNFTDSPTIDFTQSATVTGIVKTQSIDSTHIKAGGIELEGLSQDGATSGQIISWNGTAWVPATIPQKVMRYESFTATAAQTAFTTTYTAPAQTGTEMPLMVTRNGVLLEYTSGVPTVTEFTYSGTTVTTSANTVGDKITVRYLN